MLDLQDLIAHRYLIRSQLHHGYMSDVYHAYDRHLQCDVAIKVVCHEQTESRLRLQSEIQALTSLSHDHILPILDHGEYGMYHYLVMPYFKQGTLRQRILKGILTEEEAGKILDQVSSALQVAHEHGILHRDIKPSNILLDDEDDLSVYLADFGLAKEISATSEITQTGFLVGTPDYMAPELIDEPESVSSDIYSLGILLYHMLTGQPPFRGTTPLAVLWKHVREKAIPPSQLNPAITPHIEQVIMRALQKNPKKRFSSAHELSQAYSSALQSSQQTKAPPGLLIFESQPVPVTRTKLTTGILPAVARRSTSIDRSRNSSSTLRRTLISLAIIAMFVIPLSFGFLVGKNRPQISPAFSASFATSLHTSEPHVVPSPTTPGVTTPPSIPHVYPSHGKTNSHHKKHNKHKHNPQKNGDDQENTFDT